MKRVAIVGGGLAGLAAAVRLVERGIPGSSIQLFESRRRLGGRAGSFFDADSGEWIDHCQHVGMGCCERLLELARRTDHADFFRRDRTLYFLGPDGRECRFTGSRWLPPPFHLARAFAGLNYLTWRERMSIAQTLSRLERLTDDERPLLPWLVEQRQSPAALERFWSLVIVSAASETLDHCSLAVARKIFVDGFLTTRDGYHLLVPTRPLVEWAEGMGDWLSERRVEVRRGVTVESLAHDESGVFHGDVVSANGERTRTTFDAVILAAPWHRAASLVTASLLDKLPQLTDAASFLSASIRSVHLWWDRPFFDLPHAVLVGRRSQWAFRHPQTESGEFPVQVVISAAHADQDDAPSAIRDVVVRELREVWPAAQSARLLRWRLLTQPHAVFSPRPGLTRRRPSQRTSIPGLYLAGDWTQTGWPATMEGAIRSGEQAADAFVESRIS